MNIDKVKILGVVFVVYIVLMGVFIFPYYRQTQKWIEYIAIICGFAAMGVILFLIFKKRRKK